MNTDLSAQQSNLHSDKPKSTKNLRFKVPFQTLCDFFERCVKSTKHSKKKELLQKLFLLWKEDGDFFSLIRLLLPHLDKERQSYGLKESMLAKYYVEILNLAPSSPDAIRLLQWRKPSKSSNGRLVCSFIVCQYYCFISVFS
jgi:hypothetical protein